MATAPTETVSGRIPLLARSDVTSLAMLTVGCAAAALAPSLLDRAVVESLVWATRGIRPARRRQIAHALRRALPERAEHDWNDLAVEEARVRLEDYWGRLRNLGPRRWAPQVELVGEERVRAGLDRGKGVVLWRIRSGSPIATHMAFERAGLPLVHLSMATHGTGGGPPTRMSVSLVTPFYSRAETRHLAERVVIPPSGSLDYLNVLRERLRENRCVSLFGEHEGRQNVSAPFLGGRRGFALGAPSLAWFEDSTLLPVYSERTGPFAYRVVVDRPITVDCGKRRKEFVAEAVAEFAQRMETVIRAHPASWHGWASWRQAWEVDG
jgi:lauroyl/myristoyl acyltransferase